MDAAAADAAASDAAAAAAALLANRTPITTYLTDVIDNLAKEYNKDPIPVWLIDTLGAELRQISTASATLSHDYKIDSLSNLTSGKILEVHNMVYKLHATDPLFMTDRTTVIKLDNTLLATWWTLKHRRSEFSALEFPLDDGAWEGAMKNAIENDAFCAAVHDAWAFSNVYSLIPCYMTVNGATGLFMKAYHISNGNHNLPAHTTALHPPATIENIQSNSLVMLSGSHMCAGNAMLRMQPYNTIKTDPHVLKNICIGASAMRMILKMESKQYTPVHKDTAISSLFGNMSGGAPKKKTKKTKPVSAK